MVLPSQSWKQTPNEVTTRMPDAVSPLPLLEGHIADEHLVEKLRPAFLNDPTLLLTSCSQTDEAGNGREIILLLVRRMLCVDKRILRLL